MKEILRRLWNFIRVRSAVNTAKRFHKQTGKKYYILQINGKLHVLTRVQINYLIEKKVLCKRLRQDYFLRKYALTVVE